MQGDKTLSIDSPVLWKPNPRRRYRKPNRLHAYLIYQILLRSLPAPKAEGKLARAMKETCLAHRFLVVATGMKLRRNAETAFSR